MVRGSGEQVQVRPRGCTGPRGQCDAIGSSKPERSINHVSETLKKLKRNAASPQFSRRSDGNEAQRGEAPVPCALCSFCVSADGL